MEKLFTEHSHSSITIDSLSYSIGQTLLLNKLEFTLQTGDSLAITGPNGSGKTTLLQLMAGLLKPDRGNLTITIDNKPVPASLIIQSIGFMGNNFNPYLELTAVENISFMCENDQSHQQKLLEMFGLANHQNKPVRNYSSGMLQRLKLILALINNPPILLMDEPGLNLDTSGKEVLFNLLHSISDKKIIIIATNDDTETTFCSGELDLAKQYN